MRSKILTGAVAFTLTTTAGLATTTPASAQYARWSTGNVVTDVAAGIVGYSYAYVPGYSYGYYGAYGWRHQHYRGGPHPR
jgi:hypothetical protein